MKSKILSLIIIVSATLPAIAQRPIIPTELFKVQGKIKTLKAYTLGEIDAFPKIIINDQVIYNHNGEIKDTLTGMKGVLLKTILSEIDYVYEKPKTLNEFYFVFIASDDYKVVFSWNELFNTEIGNNLYLITEMDGKKLKDINQRIICISTADLKVGRRYIRALDRIEVKQIN